MVLKVAVKVSSRLGFAMRQLADSLSLNPAVNGYLFSNQERLRQQKERDVLRFSSAVPKIQWGS